MRHAQTIEKSVSPKNPKGGYSYSFSDEEIKKYLSLPIEMRLKWLEDSCQFLYETLEIPIREIQSQFRKGLI